MWESLMSIETAGRLHSTAAKERTATTAAAESADGTAKDGNG
jgi:hypothetical protein